MEGFSGLEYDQESISDEDVITKTNNLLHQFNLPTQVTSVSDITASLFVVLYESLFSDRLPGIIRQPVTREDEVQNCQTVVDILSVDVIKDNLSHIRGEDIVDGKVQAISNLIDIFTFLFEYVIKQIESDVPSDTDDDFRSVEQLETPIDLDVDALSPDFAAGTASASASETDTRGNRYISKNGNAPMPSQSELSEDRLSEAPMGGGDAIAIRENQPTAAARVRPAPRSTTTKSDKPDYRTLDSTEELIREGEAVEKKLNEEKEVKAAWETQTNTGVKAGQFDFIGVRPTQAATGSTTTQTAAPPISFAPPADSSNAAPLVPSVLPTFETLAAPGPRLARPSSSENASNMSATAPPMRANKRPTSANRDEKLRSTVGPISYHSRLTPEKPYQSSEEPIKGLSSSYGDLHQMVQRTAALTRAALNTSPMRMQKGRTSALDITDLSGERFQVPPSEAMKLAEDLNLPPSERIYQGPDAGDANDLSRMQQNKVAFSDKSASTIGQSVLTEETARSREQKNMFPEDQSGISEERFHPKKDYRRMPPTSQYGWETRGYLPDRLLEQQQRPQRFEQGIYLSDSEADQNFAEKLRHRNREVVDDVLSTGSDADARARARSQWLARRELEQRAKERQAKLSLRLQEMGKPSLADAQRHLETENTAFRRKQDFLKKMYRAEYEDVSDEVKNQIEKEQQVLKDMDTEYRRLVQAAAVAASKPAAKKSKNAPKPKGYLLPSTRKVRKQHPTVSSKVRRRSSSIGLTPEARARPLSVGDDEDLMPILLEEFPHLYMSEHTWHELWRRGIAQIENLTRAYEESKRKKSKAQQQVEEAARKHELLASIVKKQLEHNKRMRDLNDQKRQQAVMKNKVHEKRVQSARARRYYNDYQVRTRAKMLKRRSREEMIFKNLFKDGLAIQKDRIRELRRYAREQRDKQAKKRQDEIDSLENFYRDQFEMLVERIAKDREDLLVREHAQQKTLDKMKKDLRRKMEKEIVDIQSQLFRDEDDAYYRQLDADRLRHELHLAKYQTRV